jgi:hypothetical protein
MLGVSRPPDPGWEAAAQTPCICGAFPNPRGPSPIRRPAGAVRSANPECPKVMPSYSPTCALKIIYTHIFKIHIALGVRAGTGQNHRFANKNGRLGPTRTGDKDKKTNVSIWSDSWVM